MEVDRRRLGALLLASLFVGVATAVVHPPRAPAPSPGREDDALAPHLWLEEDALLPVASPGVAGVQPTGADGRGSPHPPDDESARLVRRRRRRQASRRPPWDLPAFPASRFDWAERGKRIGDYFREWRMRRKYGWMQG